MSDELEKFPIIVRSRNRPVYLDVTLKSLTASNIPDGVDLVVMDDCSDDDIAVRYVDTDDIIKLPEQCVWLGPDHGPWKAYVGGIMPVSQLVGIKSRYNIIKPETRMGVRGGVFWSINYMFENYPDAECINCIEGDAVFNADWYEATIKGWRTKRSDKGPNGTKLGIISCYDRKAKSPNAPMNSIWRSLRKLSSGRWNCGNGIGGVHYLITREFWEHSKKSFHVKYNAAARAGDTMLQGMCANAQFSIACTSPSYCQHIGIESTAWPAKGWRYTKGFKKPFAFEVQNPDAPAFSWDWLRKIPKDSEST